MSGRALILSHHSDIVGGGEISLLTLLKGLRHTNWEPVLAVPEDGVVASRARALGIDVFFVPMPPIRPRLSSVSSVRRIRRLLRNTKPLIVHANGSRAMFYAGLAARSTRVPALWHLRILDPDPRLDRVLARLATDAIAISSAVHDRLRPWPRLYDRCHVVPNGLDLDEFAASKGRAEVRASLGIGGDEIIVMTVGRLVEFKGYSNLVETIAQVKERGMPLKCVIVGDGPEFAALQQQARRLALGDSIVLTGQREDVADLLQAADVFVLPSPQEGFGRVVIEAMAMRLPVVAIDRGGPSEIVVHGTSGLLVPPHPGDDMAEAIMTLASDPERREEFGKAGRQRVEEHYTSRRHAELVAEVYESTRAKRAT